MTPKLHVGDTAPPCTLLGIDANTCEADRTLLGQVLETFVFQKLRRQASRQEQTLDVHHFRDRDGCEVGASVERGAVAGSEVRATATAAEFRGLRRLEDGAGRCFPRGVVRYDGTMSSWFGGGVVRGFDPCAAGGAVTAFVPRSAPEAHALA